MFHLTVFQVIAIAVLCSCAGFILGAAWIVHSEGLPAQRFREDWGGHARIIRTPYDWSTGGDL